MTYLEYKLGHPAPSLESAWPIAKEALGNLATGPNFQADLETAFGKGLDFQKAAALAADWGAGDFSGLPEIEVRPSGEINGAMGAFSGDTNTIYFSQEFLSAGNSEAVAGVWLEEVGHFVDSVVNSSDAPGDEGEIFSRLVRGDVLSGLELELLRGEDDGATVVLNGVEVAIEMAKIGFGQTISDSINPSGQLDSYTFNANKGDGVTVRMGSTSEVDPKISIYRPDGTLLKEAFTAFDDTYSSAQLEAALDQKGTYTVLASDNFANDTGNYSISLQRTNNPGKAKALAPGDTVEDKINFGGQLNSYIFQADGKNGKVIINMGSTSDVDPRIQVFAPDGSLIETAFIAFDDTYSSIQLEAPLEQKGTYTVLASDNFANDTGDYSLSIQGIGISKPKEPKPEPPKPEPKLPGTPTTGSNKKDNLKGSNKKDIINGKGGNDKINGGGGNDKLNGGGGKDNLIGGGGKDNLIGGKGNDKLNGGKGADRLAGGPGNDIYFIDNTGDIVIEGGTAIATGGTATATATGDTVNTSVSVGIGKASKGSAKISQFVENIKLTGKKAINATVGKGNNDITGNKAKNVINAGSGNDNVNGGGGNDKLDGGKGKDNLIGGKGNDVLDGGKGPDKLKGGAGNDTYFIDHIGDIVIEGGTATATGGTATATATGDTVNTSVSVSAGKASRGSAKISQFVENIILTGKKAINATAGKGSNDITGNNANNIINAGSGDDNVNGGGGNDIINAGGGNDNVNGDGGNDIINGGSGSDNMNGDGGNDIINGGSGNDTLVGGPGSDILNGGSGKDRFLYQSNRRFRSQDFGADTIAKFVVGQDDIVLDKTTFDSLESKPGNGLVKNDFATIKGKASAATSSAEIVYNSSTGDLFYNANGRAPGFGGGGKFATLTHEAALSRSDFMVQN